MGTDKDTMQNLMYKVISNLSKSKYKIIFKGSLLLSALMEDADITTPSRLSRDFDGDIQVQLTIEEALVEIESALTVTGVKYKSIEIDARTTESQFFFNVYDSMGMIMFNIDLGLKINPWHTTYEFKNGIVLYGQTLAKIFWDKICVVSSDEVEFRPWDVFDMYLLSLRKDLIMSDIIAVKNGTGRKLGDFKMFLFPTDKIKSVWKRRRYIKERPNFDVMFGRVRDLCTPFITGGITNATWSPTESLWYEGELTKDSFEKEVAFEPSSAFSNPK